MGARRCPVCGKLRVAEAAECACGHVFAEPVLVPVTADGERLCPRCGRTCRRTRAECLCGHGFDEDLEQVHHMLVHSMTVGWASLFVGILGLLAAPLLLIATFSVKLGAMLFAGGTVLAAKGARDISIARRGLRVYKLPDKLPAARLLKR